MVVQRPLLSTHGVEKQIEGITESLSTGVVVGHGLIIGQRSSTPLCNDHVIYLARTPLPDNINIANISAQELEKKIGGDNIDVEWMSEHVKQVVNALRILNFKIRSTQISLGNSL